MADGKNVLLVDDDTTILRVGSTFLKRLEIEVRQAESGNEARRFIEEGLRPDVIVTDLNMPDGTGADLLSFVRAYAETAETPVIVLTASEEKQELQELWSLGCTELYRKPVRYASLLDRVAEHLGLDVRRAKRFDVNLSAVLQLADQAVVEGKACNLSSSGVWVETSTQVEAEKLHEIVLKLPFPTGAELVTMNVQLVREAHANDGSTFGYGARFLPGSGEQRRMIDEYIRSLEF